MKRDWKRWLLGDWSVGMWLIHLVSAAVVLGLGALYIIFVLPPSP